MDTPTIASRVRVKIPIAAALCTVCFEPRLATNGTDVYCLNCGTRTNVSEHGKEVGKFARQVRRHLRRTKKAAA